MNFRSLQNLRECFGYLTYTIHNNLLKNSPPPRKFHRSHSETVLFARAIESVLLFFKRSISRKRCLIRPNILKETVSGSCRTMFEILPQSCSARRAIKRIQTWKGKQIEQNNFNKTPATKSS